MAGRASQKSETEQQKMTNDDTVIVPADLLNSLLESNAKQLVAIDNLSRTIEKFLDTFSQATIKNQSLQAQLRDSVDTLAEYTEKSSTTRKETFQQQLLEKLDTLTESLASEFSPSRKQIEQEMKKLADRRGILLSKCLHAEKLSKYYSDLLARPNQFLPPMYRTKINETTPAFELPHHKQLAIDRVRSEVKLLETRVINWRKQMQEFESSLNTSASSLDESGRADFYARLAKDDEKAMRNREESFEKIRQSYEREINREGADKDLFLLTIADRGPRQGRRNKRYRFSGWPQNPHDYRGSWNGTN